MTKGQFMSGYDSKSCNALEKAYYTPMEAAIRWCNLVNFEDKILDAMQGSPIPFAGQFPNWPCLRVNAEKIMDAINNENLPHGRDGKTVSTGDHVAPARRTVRHTDLRKWMAEHYPDQKPAFLFDETERKTHAAINAESFRALQADCEANRISLEKKSEQYRVLKNNYENLEYERDALKGMVEKYSKAETELSSRERTTLLKIIIGMAMRGYNYAPRKQRNDSVAEIESDLEVLGISVSDDTIRKYLAEAKELLPSEVLEEDF
jgi:hypothetical protein